MMRIIKRNDIVIAKRPENLDFQTADDVQDRLLDLIDEGALKILCDFSKTDHISSRGLRAILAGAKRMKKTGGELVFCALGQNVYTIFKISGFDQIFRIFDTQEEGLAGLK